MKKRHQQKLIFLSLVMVFLWNMPLLSLAQLPDQLFGFPVFYAYVFLVWAILIVVVFGILKKHHE